MRFLKRSGSGWLPQHPASVTRLRGSHCTKALSRLPTAPSPSNIPVQVTMATASGSGFNDGCHGTHHPGCVRCVGEGVAVVLLHCQPWGAAAKVSCREWQQKASCWHPCFSSTPASATELTEQVTDSHTAEKPLGHPVSSEWYAHADEQV